MNCPVCKSENTKVNGSVTEFPTVNHRYLSCKDCGTIYQTIEKILENTIVSKYYLQFTPVEPPADKTIPETPVKTTNKPAK